MCRKGDYKALNILEYLEGWVKVDESRFPSSGEYVYAREIANGVNFPGNVRNSGAHSVWGGSRVGILDVC